MPARTDVPEDHRARQARIRAEQEAELEARYPGITAQTREQEEANFNTNQNNPLNPGARTAATRPGVGFDRTFQDPTTGVPYYDLMGYTREEFEALSPDDQAAVTARGRDISSSRGVRNADGSYGAGTGPRPWQDLQKWLPSEDELSVNYQESEYAKGPSSSAEAQSYADQRGIDAQMGALRGMQDVYSARGMNASDRSQQQQARMMAGMASRNQRDGALASAESAGLGSSGAAAAARFGALDSYAGNLSGMDTDMQMSAQRQALQAMQGAGDTATAARGSSFQEAYSRGEARDRFEQGETDRLQRWYNANTNRRNQTRESRADAQQQSYGNRAALLAGQRGQLNATTQLTMTKQQRAEDKNDKYLQAGVSTISTLAGR